MIRASRSISIAVLAGRKAFVLVALVVCGAAFHTDAQAQVQRSFVNLGFEDPLSTNINQCIAQWDESAIPGWTTTHPIQALSFNTCTPIQGPQPGRLIELWHRGGVGFAGGPVTSRAGTTHAELNAQALSRLYQNVCLVTGETVAWRLSHRGRNSFSPPVATAYDVMRLQVDASTVATLSSSPVSTFAPPVIGVFGGTASGVAGPNGWTDYTGTFVYTGSSGVRQIGFESVSTQDGGTQGNFLDEIQITLLPYVEFGLPTTFTTLEGTSITVPSLRVSGTVPAGGITVPVTVAGTATSGSDYTPFTLTYTVPAGAYYDASFAPSIASLSSIQDTLIENNETVVMTLTSGSSYVITSTTSCGTGPANSTITWTIIDNDVDLLTTKTASVATPVVGTPFTYTVTFRNNTAAPTLAPTTAHQVTAVIADLVPAGMTFGSWNCVAANGASCPATSGSGAISGNALLPAGSGAAGGLLTYTITATATGAPNCAVITNTSNITVPSGFQEGTSVQAGFTSPASGGTANNTASVNVDPVCPAVLRLQKALPNGRISNSDQFALSIAGAGGPATATTTGTGSTASGVATLTNATLGSAYTLSETAAGTTVLANYGTSYACTNARAGGQTPSGTGASFSVTPVDADDLTCTFTNAAVLQPDFGTCDARMYLSQGPDVSTNTTLYNISTASNPFTYPLIAQGGVPYNGIGYNPIDNYVYAMQVSPGGTNNLIRVGADGSTVLLGAVGGLPAANYLAGDISPAGVYYVRESNATVMYSINLSTRVATAIPLSGAGVSGTDMAWYNNLLYSVTGAGQMSTINPATGAVNLIGSPTGIGSFGAMYGASNGLFGNNNTGLGFYQLDPATGTSTLISGSPGANQNDGAHCATAPITFAADIAVAKTDGDTIYAPGTNVVYTITATNLGPFGAQNITVSDPLPAGITTASWTCSATSGGSVCGVANGTGAINDTALDLPVGAVATYTLTMAVPGTFTGNLVNTVTATVAPGTTDPNPGNNTATDTNTQGSQANLIITKSNNLGTVTSGGTTTYTIVATNNGPSPSNNAVVRDDWTTVPGLNCSAGPATCVASGTAGTQCPALASVTPAGLQAGLAIPIFPSGGIVTFSLQCAVTSTGL